MKALASPEFDGPRYFLFGLVSVGVPSCGKFALPAVYTNVSVRFYLGEIFKIIPLVSVSFLVLRLFCLKQ